jgi:hypothetical protein
MKLEIRMTPVLLSVTNPTLAVICVQVTQQILHLESSFERLGRRPRAAPRTILEFLSRSSAFQHLGPHTRSEPSLYELPSIGLCGMGASAAVKPAFDSSAFGRRGVCPQAEGFTREALFPARTAPINPMAPISPMAPIATIVDNI